MCRTCRAWGLPVSLQPAGHRSRGLPQKGSGDVTQKSNRPRLGLRRAPNFKAEGSVHPAQPGRRWADKGWHCLAKGTTQLRTGLGIMLRRLFVPRVNKPLGCTPPFPAGQTTHQPRPRDSDDAVGASASAFLSSSETDRSLARTQFLTTSNYCPVTAMHACRFHTAYAAEACQFFGPTARICSRIDTVAVWDR